MFLVKQGISWRLCYLQLSKCLLYFAVLFLPKRCIVKKTCFRWIRQDAAQRSLDTSSDSSDHSECLQHQQSCQGLLYATFKAGQENKVDSFFNFQESRRGFQSREVGLYAIATARIPQSYRNGVRTITETSTLYLPNRRVRTNRRVCCSTCCSCTLERPQHESLRRKGSPKSEMTSCKEQQPWICNLSINSRHFEWKKAQVIGFWLLDARLP